MCNDVLKGYFPFPQKMHLLRCEYVCLFVWEKIVPNWQFLKIADTNNSRLYHWVQGHSINMAALLWYLWNWLEVGYKMGHSSDFTSSHSLKSRKPLFILLICGYGGKQQQKQKYNKQRNKLKSPENKHPASSFKVKHAKI